MKSYTSTYLSDVILAQRWDKSRQEWREETNCQNFSDARNTYISALMEYCESKSPAIRKWFWCKCAAMKSASSCSHQHLYRNNEINVYEWCIKGCSVRKKLVLLTIMTHSSWYTPCVCVCLRVCAAGQWTQRDSGGGDWLYFSIYIFVKNIGSTDIGFWGLMLMAILGSKKIMISDVSSECVDQILVTKICDGGRMSDFWTNFISNIRALNRKHFTC